MGQAPGVATPVIAKFTYGSGGAPNYTVPAGKQLIIKYVTGKCRVLNEADDNLAIAEPIPTGTINAYKPYVFLLTQILPANPANINDLQDLTFNITAEPTSIPTRC